MDYLSEYVCGVQCPLLTAQCPSRHLVFYDFQNRTKRRIDEIKITRKSNQLWNEMSASQIHRNNERKRDRNSYRGIAHEIKINDTYF